MSVWSSSSTISEKPVGRCYQGDSTPSKVARAMAIDRQSADCLSASAPSIPLQQPARLYCQIIQRHLQFRYGRVDFWMLSDLLLQRLENLVSTFNMRFYLGLIRLVIAFARCLHGHIAPYTGQSSSVAIVRSF
jgi:hypothetical protein